MVTDGSRPVTDGSSPDSGGGVTRGVVGRRAAPSGDHARGGLIRHGVNASSGGALRPAVITPATVARSVS